MRLDVHPRALHGRSLLESADACIRLPSHVHSCRESVLSPPACSASAVSAKVRNRSSRITKRESPRRAPGSAEPRAPHPGEEGSVFTHVFTTRGRAAAAPFVLNQQHASHSFPFLPFLPSFRCGSNNDDDYRTPHVSLSLTCSRSLWTGRRCPMDASFSSLWSGRCSFAVNFILTGNRT